jgi:hypothetical protein
MALLATIVRRGRWRSSSLSRLTLHSAGSDAKISGSKIEPLDSDIKVGVPHDVSSQGVVGSDRNIDQTRIDPVGGHGKCSIRDRYQRC